jgi:hypothetical protein
MQHPSWYRAEEPSCMHAHLLGDMRNSRGFGHRGTVHILLLVGDGEEGRVPFRVGPDGHDHAHVLLKFRPIAPKPAAMVPKPVAVAATTTGRGKRKAVGYGGGNQKQQRPSSSRCRLLPWRQRCRRWATRRRSRYRRGHHPCWP